MSCNGNARRKAIFICLASVMALSACLGSAPAQAQNLVTNGDFETGVLTGWTLTNAGTFDGIHSRGEYGLGAFPQGGDFFVAFNGGNQPAQATLSQLLNTVPGQSYNLSFLYGTYSLSGGDQRVTLTISDANSNTVLLQDTVQDASASADPQLIFASYSFSFSALGSQTLIAFADIAPDSTGADGFLDNVSVAPAGVAPEPGSLSLLMVAVGAAVLRRRSKRP